MSRTVDERNLNCSKQNDLCYFLSYGLAIHIEVSVTCVNKLIRKHKMTVWCTPKQLHANLKGQRSQSLDFNTYWRHTSKTMTFASTTLDGLILLNCYFKTHLYMIYSRQTQRQGTKYLCDKVKFFSRQWQSCWPGRKVQNKGKQEKGRCGIKVVWT